MTAGRPTKYQDIVFLKRQIVYSDIADWRAQHIIRQT